MSRRTSPPFRADHVGSLLRPRRLLDARDDFAAGRLTIPSPNMVHYRGGPAMLDPDVYPDMEEFWSDLAAAYADEVARLGELGCTYLQFDDTSLAYLNDPAQRAEIAGRGEDAEHMHLRYIRQINAAVAGKPAGSSSRAGTPICSRSAARMPNCSPSRPPSTTCEGPG